jgi:predicted KAP-like P-loop ATPase
MGGVIARQAEKLHAELTRVLYEQKKRFLIVIDDIDRLAPEEALLMFRLVKSIGRLPNVIYLLVFDRHLAEAIVAERYPSEGAHYLEKIIQAGFDMTHQPRSSTVDLIEAHAGAAPASPFRPRDAELSSRKRKAFGPVDKDKG